MSCQIEPTPRFFQISNNPKTLHIVLVAVAQESIQRFLPGMTEGRMPQIVRQRNRFRQILIQSECPANHPGYLRHFEDVTHPCRIVVSGGSNEYLCLSAKASECI